MNKFLSTILLLSAFKVWGAEPSIFVVRHLPSSKVIGEINVGHCDNTEKPFFNTTDLTFKCLIVKEAKFITFYERKNVLVTLKGNQDLAKPLSNSTTIAFRSGHLEIAF